MASQIHTKFTTDHVKELLEKYVDGAVERKHPLTRLLASNCSLTTTGLTLTKNIKRLGNWPKKRPLALINVC